MSERNKELENLRDYLTVSEAASVVGVSASTLRNWDRAGKLDAVRHPVNAYRLYRRSDLEGLLRRWGGRARVASHDHGVAREFCEAGISCGGGGWFIWMEPGHHGRQVARWAGVTEKAPVADVRIVREFGPATIALQDALAGMAKLRDASFDLAIADPPYGASTRASWQLADGHGLSGFGGAWKLAAHDWDRRGGYEGLAFSMQWLSELRRLVRPTGSIWIHATYHNSGFINVACQALGLEIINEVVWFKRNAFPNLACRRLTASHETLLWVHTGGKKRSYRFNYEAVKAAKFEDDTCKQPGRQMRTVWDIPNNKAPDELRFGRHPTQKPVRLTERLLLISGAPGGSLLIPFLGSGTEAVAALRWDMKPTGFETDKNSFELASKRLSMELKRVTSAPSLFGAWA